MNVSLLGYLALETAEKSTESEEEELTVKEEVKRARNIVPNFLQQQNVIVSVMQATVH